MNKNLIKSTTIISIRKDNEVVIAGDGQASFGNTVLKANVKKIRHLGSDNKVIAGFAGSTADAFALFERLEAMMIVADKDISLLLSGTGDVIETDDGILGIGSGGPYAISAARALSKNTNLDAEKIAYESLNIAADICIYTNHNIICEKLKK